MFKLGGKKPPARQSSLEQARANKTAYNFYSSSRNTNEASPRPRIQQGRANREVRINARYIPTAIMLLLIVIIVAFSTTLSSTPMIIFADGQSPYHSSSTYKKDITTLFNDSILNKSKLTISSVKLEKEITERFPELDVAKVVLPIIGRRPVVTLHARQPVLLWQSQSKLLVIDSSGFAVSEANQISSSIRDKLLNIQDTTNKDVSVGDKVITSDAVVFIDAIRQQLVAKGVQIDKIVLPTVANEADIYLKDTKYYLKVDYTGDSRLQAGSFFAVKDKFGSALPGEYVDVRVEEKVFFK